MKKINLINWCNNNKIIIIIKKKIMKKIIIIIIITIYDNYNINNFVFILIY